MSFQHFRVPIAPHPGSETYHTNPGPSSYQAAANELTQVAFSSQIQSHGDPYQHDLQPMPNASLNKKGPYGSGDADDGYTLCFPSMAAFLEWKQKEEDEKMIEFVKGDSHQSRANPPRFKEHTKLVCARHSRSGRKKYVKKYPDRVRKVPSRKLEGQGCPASISYKTYHDSEQVRVAYASDHSHPIGLENLPFTRRGRRAQAEQQPRKSRPSRPSNAEIPAEHTGVDSDQSQSPISPMSSPTTVDSMHSMQMHSPVELHSQVPPLGSHSHSSQSSQSSAYSPHMHNQQHHIVPAPVPAAPAAPMTITVPEPQPYVHTQPPPALLPQQQVHPQAQYQPHPHAQSLPQPPPPQSIPQPHPQTHAQPTSPTYNDTVARQQQILAHAVDTLDNKWDRMEAIFQHVRDTARSFAFTPASVAMLESVLWKMYAEIPPAAPAPMAMMPMNPLNGMATTNMGTTLNGAPQPNGHS